MGWSPSSQRLGKVETLGVTVHVNVRLLEVVNDNEVRGWILGPVGGEGVGEELFGKNHLTQHERTSKGKEDVYSWQRYLYSFPMAIFLEMVCHVWCAWIRLILQQIYLGIPHFLMFFTPTNRYWLNWWFGFLRFPYQKGLGFLNILKGTPIRIPNHPGFFRSSPEIREIYTPCN